MGNGYGGLFKNAVSNINGSAYGIITGLDAGLPNPALSQNTTLYVATDTQRIYELIGGAWVVVINGGVAATPSLEDVTLIGSTTDKDITVQDGTGTTTVSKGVVVGDDGAAAQRWLISYSAIAGFPGIGIGTDPFNGLYNFITSRAALTGNRRHQLQDSDGIIAHLSDIPAVPAAFLQPHLKQTVGAAPTAVLGPGAGVTGRVLTLSNATDTAGHIVLTTGGLPGGIPTAFAAIMSFTIATPFSNVPHVFIDAVTQITAQLTAAGAQPFANYNAATTTAWTMTSNAVPLAPNTTYSWNWFLVG